MVEYFSWIWSEHGQPMLMLILISIVVGWGFRIGWLFADRFRKKDK